ncbi:MAG: CvpA family protein, partial [Planctomycetota bacterium]
LQTYPGPDYLLPVCFATLFAVMCGIARSLRNRFTAAEVPSFNLVDRIGGASLGLVNGVVISGVVLILWSLMPFAPAVPADWGRVRTRELPLDSGALMLQFYSHASDRMGGEDFVLRTPDDERETVNEGEELPETRYPALENGWLWLYRHHADFRPEDVERAKGQTE